MKTNYTKDIIMNVFTQDNELPLSNLEFRPSNELKSDPVNHEWKK